MKKIFLVNAISINMFNHAISKDKPIALIINEIDMDYVKQIMDDYRFITISAIGHDSTAYLISVLLGKEVKADRIEVKVDDDTFGLIVFALGVRLPEGKVLEVDEIMQYKDKVKVYLVRFEKLEVKHDGENS